MYLNSANFNGLASFLAWLIETIVVFELGAPASWSLSLIGLIETIVVFESFLSGTLKNSSKKINRNNSCIWISADLLL